MSIAFRQDGKRVRKPAGKDAMEAQNLQRAKEAEFAAIDAGVSSLAQTDDRRVSLTAAIAEY